MAGQIKLMKTKWYPRPHNFDHSWYHGLETAVSNVTTIYPLVMQDEGLGAPSSYAAHPENAAFVEAAETNCYTDSKIDNILARIEFSLAKGAVATDKLNAIKIAYMPIFMSFLEDYTAIDDLSSSEIQDILELTTESTDKQGYPLYNDVKMVEKYANSALMPTKSPGLTTTQVLEGVAFSHGSYYDMLHYMTNSGKLKVTQGGMKWLTLTPNRPIANINIHLRPKVKSMNKYTFFGVMITVPAAGGKFQIPVSGDTTNINHVGVITHVRYNEWNENFNMARV